jgi:O-antigen/teichoic acid export membrane protein
MQPDQTIEQATETTPRGVVSRLRMSIKQIWNHGGVRRYSSSTSWSLLNRIITTIVSFAVTAYMVRYLGPANYGQLSYAISFVGIFGVLSTLGIDSIVYRNLIDHKDRHAEYLGTALGLKLIAGICAYIITVSVATFYVPQTDISHFLIWIIASTYIFNAWNIIVFEFQSHINQKTLSIISLIVLLTLSVLKLLVIAFDKGIIYFAFIFALEAILYTVSYILVRKRLYVPISSWVFNIKTAKTILKEGWPLLLASSFALIYTRIDQVMIKHLIDNSSVGIYDAAVRIAEAWLTIPNLIVVSLFPSIMHARKVSFASYKKRTLGLTLSMAGLACIASIFVMFFGSWMIEILYGKAYIAGTSVLHIYTWASIWTSIGLVTYYYLLAERKTYILFWSSCLAMVINVILNFMWIPQYGIVGAAWATFFSYIATAFPLITLLRKKSISPDVIFPDTTPEVL